MADPLHTNEIPELDTRTTSPIGTGLEQNWDDVASESVLRRSTLRADRELETGGNDRLNRTAEQIGGALGRAVSQARRVPDSARRGLHVVRDRAQQTGGSTATNLSTSAASLADTTKQRAGELMDAAEARGREVLDKAEQLSQTVAERASELKQQLGERSRELRESASFRAEQARLTSERLVRERPLQVLGGIAGAAFVTGVLLRIVRSRNASRY